jgi:hypothetical protein
MDTLEEPQLFGAPADYVSGTSLSIGTGKLDLHSVVFHGHVNNRKNPMVLRVYVPREQGVQPVIGRMTPILMRTQHLSPSLMRRTLWAIYNTLLGEGYDVELKGCSTEPR